jgi:hypothetical protein
MTWDDDYIYIGITNANETQGTIIYLDFQDAVPVNGSGAGSTIGKSDYGFAPNLPFRADAYIFFNNDNRAIRTDAGTWTTTVHGDDDSGLQNTGMNDYDADFYASNSGTNNREIRIAWNDLTGAGAPTTFNWLGYVGYSTGLYAEAPVENPGGNINGSNPANMVRYFNVSNLGSPTSGFGQNSYTFIGDNITNFGAISCHDFTMDGPGKTITRANSGEWGIGGDLIISNGTINNGSSTSQLNVNGNMRAFNGGAFNAGSSSASVNFGGNVNLDGNGTINGGSSSATINVSGIVTLDGNGTLNGGSSTAPINVTGNLLNLGSGNITLSSQVGGDLSVKGNFTQNSVFNCNEREVIFNGNSVQSISGNFTGSNHIDYCRINGAGIQLQTNLEVDNRLSIINGNAQIGNLNVTLGTSLLEGTAGGTTQSAFSSSNMVITNGTGKLSRQSNGVNNLLFPVGTTGNYSAILVNNTSGPDEIFQAKVDAAVTTPSDPTKVVNRQWDLSETTPGGNNVTLTLYWNNANEAASFDENGMVVIGHFVAGSWEETAATVASNSATASGFTSFSPFAVANAQALPVEFDKINISQFSEGHLLTFSTATETNNAYFNIERSTDSRNWEKLGSIAGAGTTQQEQQYRFLDEAPLPGLNYYRVKQVDYDGSFSYSAIVSARWEGKSQVQLFPNPADDQLQISGLPTTDGPITIEIIDMTGRVMLRQTWNQSAINVAQLADGVYSLLISSSTGVIDNQRLFIH